MDLIHTPDGPMPALDPEVVRILATDISTRILAQAREATYEADLMADVSADLARASAGYRAHGFPDST